MSEAEVAAWLRDEPAKRRWLAKRDLRAGLAAGRGFVRFRNFLPEPVAERALRALQALPSRTWERTSAEDRDDSARDDSIPHHFSLAEVEARGPLLDVARLLWRLLPETLPNFTAARYGRADHIAPHDDLVREQYTRQEVRALASSYTGQSPPAPDAFGLRLDTWGRGRRGFRREVAAVYYLTKRWPASAGGHFIDLETGRTILPEFNTLIAFAVPRWHMVSPVRAPRLQRHSIFGWWLVQEEEGEADGAPRPVARPRRTKRPAARARRGAATKLRAAIVKRPAAARPLAAASKLRAASARRLAAARRLTAAAKPRAASAKMLAAAKRPAARTEPKRQHKRLRTG